jgi:hypothetical protein
MSQSTSDMQSSNPADSSKKTSEVGTSAELEFDAFELLQSIAEGSRFVRGDAALSITKVDVRVRETPKTGRHRK